MMLVLLAAAASAVATAPLPAYDPGDAFVFSDGRVERAAAAYGMVLVPSEAMQTLKVRIPKGLQTH